MAMPKLPRDIARKIAKLQAPQAPPPSRQPAPEAQPMTVRTPSSPAAPRAGSLGRQALIAGWVLAAAASAAAYVEYQWFTHDKRVTVERLTADYEQKLAQQKSAADAQLAAALAAKEAAHSNAMQSAQATQTAMQAELDYAHLPALPLKVVLRPPALSGGTRIVSITNETASEFTCDVQLKRPRAGTEKKVTFIILPRAFRDLAALEGWEFEAGDRIEFSKPGFQTRKLEVQ